MKRFGPLNPDRFQVVPEQHSWRPQFCIGGRSGPSVAAAKDILLFRSSPEGCPNYRGSSPLTLPGLGTLNKMLTSARARFSVCARLMERDSSSNLLVDLWLNWDHLHPAVVPLCGISFPLQSVPPPSLVVYHHLSLTSKHVFSLVAKSNGSAFEKLMLRE